MNLIALGTAIDPPVFTCNNQQAAVCCNQANTPAPKFCQKGALTNNDAMISPGLPGLALACD
jgi:hypothetical protein